MKTQANKLSITFHRGEGVWLFNEDNQKYFDAISGLGVSGLGHSPPVILETIANKIKKIIHSPDLYRIEEQEKLAKKLCKISNMEQACKLPTGYYHYGKRIWKWYSDWCLPCAW